MKQTGFLMLALLAITGCSMSNDEVMEAIEYCEAAGYRAVISPGGTTRGVMSVYCRPKLPPKDCSS